MAIYSPRDSYRISESDEIQSMRDAYGFIMTKKLQCDGTTLYESTGGERGVRYATDRSTQKVPATYPTCDDFYVA